MFGLVLVPSTIFRSLAAGAILVGIVSVFAALTLLPAVLGLLGDRIDALRIPFFGAASGGTESRVWGRVVRAVMRRPVVSLVLAAGFLRRARAARARAPDRLAGAERAARPLRVQAGLRAAQRGVPRPDDRSRGDRGRRRRRRARGSSGSRPRSRGARSSARRRSRRASQADVTRLTVPIAGDPVGERAIDAVRELRDGRHPGRLRRRPAPRSSSAATRRRSSTTTTRSTPGSRACSRSSSGSASCC